MTRILVARFYYLGWLLCALGAAPYARADDFLDSGSTRVGQESPSVAEDSIDERVGPVAPGPEGPLFEPDPLFLQYYGMFFGPSLKRFNAYQPTPTGGVDPNFPVQMKNFLGVGYNITDEIAVVPTFYWIWRPVMGQNLTLMDPFIRLSHSRLYSAEKWNLYGDVRMHFGVSSGSRKNDYLGGLQVFQALTFIPDDEGRCILSLYGSARYNLFGKKGRGYDLELYLAPHLSYQIVPKLSFTLLYEMQAIHVFGARAGTLENDGTDLEPGLAWEISPTLTVNPYINLYPGETINFQTSSIGMTVSWRIL